MRSRVMPGSSPTMERRLCVSRLNRVDLPTLGRPTMATSGSASAPAFLGTTDLRYVGKTCLQSGLRAQGRYFSLADMPQNGLSCVTRLTSLPSGVNLSLFTARLRGASGFSECLLNVNFM